MSLVKKTVLISMCGLFFFGAMEEVSWLQRIADIQSGEFFMKNNSQAETNFHNLTVKGVKINKLIFGKLLFLFAVFHNVFLPLYARKKKWIYKKVDDLGFFMPHIALAGLYLGGAILVELFIDHERAKEHLEIIGALHYFTAIILTYGFGYKNSNPMFKNTNPKLAGLFLTSFILLLSFTGWILGNISLKDFML